MRAPPPVQITCGRSALWSMARAAVLVVAAAAFAAWAAGWCGVSQWPWAAAAAAIAAARSAFTRRLDLGEELVWDGRRWTLDGQPGAPQVMIDLDRWMLLRFRPAEGRRSRWLAVEAAGADPSLHLWRAALYSPAAQPTPTSS